MQVDIQANLRNFKDFLQVYNQMTEACFDRCIDDLNSRKLNETEESCIEGCASKFVKFNHRMMATFVEANSLIVNKRIKDVEDAQKLLDEANKKTQEVAVSV